MTIAGTPQDGPRRLGVHPFVLQPFATAAARETVVVEKLSEEVNKIAQRHLRAAIPDRDVVYAVWNA